MINWGRTDDRASRFLKELDVADLNEQLDSVRAYLKDLTGSFGKIANRQLGRARHQALDTAEEAEELMKDHLAASLIIALGIGVLIGFMIRRGME
jgi:hypothetical protein